MAAVLNLRVSQRGTRVYSVLDAGFGLSMGFYCKGEQERFSDFWARTARERAQPVLSRVGFSGARCCGELNMKVML